MTQRIKLLALVFSTLMLTYCQDASNGRRMSGFGLNGRAPLTQTGDAFTGLPNKSGIQNNELLQALINSRKQQAPIVESPISEIDYDDEKDSRAACIGSGTTDSDKDGLPDDCAEETNPDAYNGWIFGGRYYDPNSPELVITPAEEIRWREISKKYGGVNFSSMSPTSQKIFKKMELFRDPTTDSDIEPSKYAFYELGGIPILVSDLFKASKRSYLFQESQVDDMNLGIGAGDGRESPFVSRVDPATSAFDMTGFNKNTFSLLEKLPKTVVWQTNVIIPANVTHLEMAMAHAVDDSERRIKPTSALYTVFNNNDTVLLKSKLISGQNNRTIARDFADLSKNPGCLSADLKIKAHIDPNGQITPERPVFREPGKKTWTTLSQKYFSIVPIGGADCQKNFIDNTGRNNKSFFNISSNAAQRVPGVVDFNSGLSRPGIINPTLLIDGTTQSFDPVRQGLARLPIDKMDDHHVTEFLKAAHQLDPTLIKDKDKQKAETDWLAGVIDQATKQKAKVAGQPSLATTQLTQLTDQIQKLATMDPASPEYATAIAQIDKLIADLNADPNLDATQKQGLAAQVTAYGTAKQTAADTAAAAATAAKKIVKFDPTGDVELGAADVNILKGLGFDVQDENGKTFNTTDNLVKAGKITDQTLEDILEVLGEKVKSGNMTPAEAVSISRLLEDLKKSKGVDQARIKAFEDEHAKTLGEKAVVKWTPEQLDYLKTLDASPIQEAKPGLTPLMDKWSKGFAGPTEEADAKKQALEKLEKVLMNTAPDSLAKYPIKERQAVVDALKANGFIDERKHKDWTWKLEFLALWPKNTSMTNLIFTDIDVKGKKFKAINININFKVNKSELDNNAQNYLVFAVDVLRQIETAEGKKFNLLIQAHTDTDGSEAANLKLSQKRGDSVRKFLTTNPKLKDKKFDPAKIKAVGMGESQAIYLLPNGKEDKTANRRVEIIYDENPF